MLVRSLVFVAVIAVAAVQAPSLVSRYLEKSPETSGKPAFSAKARPVPVKVEAMSPGSVTLQPDEQGHYKATFRINGKSLDGIIDTGAGSIAINESTARRLGFSGNGLDFKYTVGTANGETKAAYIVLDKVEIGGIRVRDVQAAVLRDSSLSSMLVGMTFLKKLDSYRVDNGVLKLQQ
jgi:aspartyl protease family protein